MIGSLGAIPVSKKANARERQLVLDEIELQIKLVERKISQAESDGNNKNLESYMRLDNKLQRERQRIKYRMKVYYNQHN